MFTSWKYYEFIQIVWQINLPNLYTIAKIDDNWTNMEYKSLSCIKHL